MMDPLNYFSFQPVIHNSFNKGHGTQCPVCGMVHIKDPLLLIDNSSPCSNCSGFPLSLCQWSVSVQWSVSMVLYHMSDTI